jgi:antirestriction protein
MTLAASTSISSWNFPKISEAEGGAYMPDYSYNKDYPFAAFITNLGKYNEGELVGEWVKFPTTAEEMKEVFKRIGIGQRDDFGQPYEEWFITDYDCYVDGLYDKLGEYENLDELNYLASKLDEMSDSEYAQFQAGMEMGDHCGSLQEIINLTENLDCYEVYPHIEDYDDLGRYYIEELEVMQVPEHLQNYIDYEAYGRDVAMDENGSFTDQGYVRDTGDRFCEYYDGERGSIPDEYRVMTFQDDLPEEEKSEWAMDIAFDMDEFFRQNDPQYAAEHPEAHAAKEALYEKLMAGRISALDERLAALGQTQEDHLPSEIEKFKDATGYEEFLDFDPAEVKAALEDPNRSRVDEMLAAAEKAEREYAAEAAAYAQTPAAIVEQARAAQGEPVGSFSIYQLKGGNETLDHRFEPLDSIHRNGLSVKPENYELVYEAPMTAKDNLESIYTRFNVDRPADFTGHSLSVSDIVVLHQDGKDTAHYCDRAGFSEVPEFLQPAQKSREITERIQTPRGSFYLCGMTREQMEADGYGFHHASEDGKYLIMANGTQAYAVRADAPEKDNPLRTAEMTLEDDYGMIDGVINNGRRGEELEKAREHAERTQPEKKPSIRERLAAAKQECAKQQPRPATEKKPPELGER